MLSLNLSLMMDWGATATVAVWHGIAVYFKTDDGAPFGILDAAVQKAGLGSYATGRWVIDMTSGPNDVLALIGALTKVDGGY